MQQYSPFPLQESDSPEGFFGLPLQIILGSLALISSIISLSIPALYFVKRKCREHPTQLIAIISLLQALSNYNIILIAFSVYQFENILHVTQMFNFLVFFIIGSPDQTDFCQFNFSIYILLELLSLAYNISFSADLLITLKKPFFSGKKRMKFYHFFCIVFILIAQPFSIIEAQQICNKQFHKRSIYKMPKSFLISIVFFYITSFIIIVMSFTSVHSSEIRKKYIRFHRIILLTLIFLWLFPLVTNILILNGDESSLAFKIFNIGSFASLLASGGMINVVRFYNDPYVWRQVKIMIKQPFKSQKQKQKKETDEQQKQQQDIDIWNLPLAHAVSTFHHQSVVSNIIEIVMETCVGAPEQIAIQRSEYHYKEDNNYSFGGSLVGIRDIRKALKSRSKDDIKRLIKINKPFQMVCLQKNDLKRNTSEKKIYKMADYISLSEQKLLNDSKIPSLSNSPPPKSATSIDFSSKNFNPISNISKQNQTVIIKVQSFADPVFMALRLLDGFCSEQLSKTLNLSLNTQNIRKARESLGASGSFFFFSFDHRLVIKTINQQQCNLFLKFLPEYYQHIVDHPHSLISRAYGLFEVQIANISKIYFIMMENTLQAFEQNKIIYKKYDLKGSTIKRFVKNPNADVLKDINYLKSSDSFLFMSAQRKKQLFAQIISDISLLNRQNIMDYSLLLAVGINKQKSINYRVVKESDLHQQIATNQWRYFNDGHQITGKIYSISIIDYLQQFDFNKTMELTLKKMFKGGGDISSVDAKTYYQRFINFVNRIIVVIRV